MTTRPFTLAAVLLALLVVEPAVAQETDLDRLQGTWELVSSLARGREREEVVGSRLRIEGEIMRSDFWEDDPANMPPHLDIVVSNVRAAPPVPDTYTLLCIYYLDGDTLITCSAPAPFMAGFRGRPDTFESTAENACTLNTYRRVDDAE